MYIFVETPLSPVFKNTRSKIGRTKIYMEDLDSPRRELSETGLGFVVALLVAREINFSCATYGGPIQL